MHLLKKINFNNYYYLNLCFYCKTLSSVSLISTIMNNSEIPTTQRKPRYDGRSKKRNWEERRSDKGANLDATFPKLMKLNDETTTDKKIKRLKFALLMGYSGVDYFGMQRNPNTKTVEEDLFKVLLDTNFIDQDSYNQVQNMQFQRAARTDKGVSAARQVVSLKLPENFDINIVNAKLCEQIRLFAFKRVTKGFNSKTQCDGRTYIYILPTVAFSNYNSTDNIISTTTQSEFRLPKEKFDEINQLLNLYVGTKNFHNFTVKKKPQDPSAKRFIKSFICEEPFVKDGVEFCTLKVHGQSFMMHQIRKMVGLVLAVIRGMTTKETVDKSFSFEKVNVPKAPGLGLVLNYVHYDRYNFRYGEDGIHAKLIWDEVEKEIAEFQDKHILPTIINTEIKDEPMLWWIQNKLIKHSYDDIQEEEKMSDDEGDEGEDEETEELKNETVAVEVETRV